MSILVSLVVSDRNEVEGIAGLYAEVLFKDESAKTTFTLTGTASYGDDGGLDEIVIREDVLGLGAEVGQTLIRAACDYCWQAVVIGTCASASMTWQGLTAWSAYNLAPELQSLVIERVTARMASESGR